MLHASKSSIRPASSNFRSRYRRRVSDTPENRVKFIAAAPLGRLSDPRDIANACLYLASDEVKFVTGVGLEVYGGRTI